MTFLPSYVHLYNSISRFFIGPLKRGFADIRTHTM